MSVEISGYEDYNSLCYQRQMAYDNNETKQVRHLNLQIKNIRLLMGWSKEDAELEYQTNRQTYERLFILPANFPDHLLSKADN